MSQENVELIRRGLEAWRRGDTKALESLNREFVAPEFELHPLYLDKVYRGPDAARAMFADAGEFWAEYGFEIDDIIDAGEHVITIGHVVGRGKGSGVPVDQLLATVWSFDRSKAISAKTYPSNAQALEAIRTFTPRQLWRGHHRRGRELPGGGRPVAPTTGRCRLGRRARHQANAHSWGPIRLLAQS